MNSTFEYDGNQKLGQNNNMNDNYAKSPYTPEPAMGEFAPVQAPMAPAPQPYPYEAVLLSPTLYGQARLQFVRKVYAILSIQLMITAAMTVASMYSQNFFLFQIRNQWLLWVSIGLMLVSEIVVLCLPAGRRTPWNYIFLLIFTLSESYMVSYCCSYTAQTNGKYVVFMAAIMTFGITAAATAYAMITKQDFTVKWGLVVVILFSMLFMGIFSIFWYSRFLYILYCTIGVILFGIYLIIDTQMILGGKRMQFTIDHYVAAAMLLYIDIIQIFLYILAMLRR